MKAYLDLGTNIDREASLRKALELLRREFGEIRNSVAFETPPVGFTDQDAFYNMAVELETELEPDAIRVRLRELEDEMGRVRTSNKYGPRNIDMDLILYGDQIGEKLPHPQLREQLFVLLPLLELIPDGTDPATGTALKEYSARLTGHEQLRRTGFRG